MSRSSETAECELAEVIRSQARWRWIKADEFPEDRRNRQSAIALDSLVDYIEADEAESRDPGVVAALEAHIPDTGASLGGARAQRELSRYGFGYDATAMGQHEEFLKDLWVAAMQDAYDFAGEEEEDWTGQLLPCEVAGAIDRVALPAWYWQLRPKQSEPELEAAVEGYRHEREE
jgi:hypothetical protein